MVLSAVEEKEESINVIRKQIRRTKEHEVVTKNLQKIYQLHTTKKEFLPDHTSVPFRYKRQKVVYKVWLINNSLFNDFLIKCCLISLKVCIHLLSDIR